MRGLGFGRRGLENRAYSCAQVPAEHDDVDCVGRELNLVGHGQMICVPLHAPFPQLEPVIAFRGVEPVDSDGRDAAGFLPAGHPHELARFGGISGRGVAELQEAGETPAPQ